MSQRAPLLWRRPLAGGFSRAGENPRGRMPAPQRLPLNSGSPRLPRPSRRGVQDPRVIQKKLRKLKISRAPEARTSESSCGIDGNRSVLDLVVHALRHLRGQADTLAERFKVLRYAPPCAEA